MDNKSAYLKFGDEIYVAFSCMFHVFKCHDDPDRLFSLKMLTPLTMMLKGFIAAHTQPQPSCGSIVGSSICLN